MAPGPPQWPPPGSRVASQVLELAHFGVPPLLLLVFLAALVAQSYNAVAGPSHDSTQKLKGPDGKPLPQHPSPTEAKDGRHAGPRFSRAQHVLFTWLSVAVVASFIGQAILIVVHALTERPWWCGQATAIYVISSVFFFSLVLISLIDTKPAPTVVHLITWFTALALEAVIFGILTPLKLANKPLIAWDISDLALRLVRLLLLLALIGSYAAFGGIPGLKNRKAAKAESGDPHERTGLLRGGHADLSGHTEDANANGTAQGSYGATQATSAPPERPATPPARWARPTTVPSKSWWEYIKGYSLFFPYLWPSKSRRLQLVVVICFCLVLLQRVINVLVPYQVGIVTDILSGENGEEPRIPWIPICVYAFYRLLQGSSGALGALRSTLWIPIGQYSYEALSTSSFEHVHSLSLDFHLGKKTGEVLSALSKGSAINTFLEQVTFQVVPMLIDLCIAVAYFLIVFDAYYALVIAIVTFCYIYLTIRLAQWRVNMRRIMVNASREEDAVKNDSMVSYETVKYFNAEAYEFNRYRQAVRNYLRAEYNVNVTLNVMNVAQNLVFTLGLLILSFLAAYQVTTGQRKVGRFVALLTYMSQLQGPLNFFGTFYRSIQSAMINSERMLELFKEQPTVVDDADVEPLTSCQGKIEFQDVRFSYDGRKPALDGLSFVTPPSTKTALVGESGGGKSTVFRLLFRFYNANGGRILVDGHDVRDVTIDSLRRHIGIVPQDTVLFNETLMYNLKYANPDATDEMVFDACRAASIHDRILSFPDGYLTKVGERGLRLSGGEKQRVAIARTIIKNPPIILLDEATAALDSETEQHIQSALEKLGQGRTMLVIAHRLSTVTNADQILCLHNGEVVESGTHEELLELGGRYAGMWTKQIRAERAAEEARVLRDRAEQLRQEGDAAAAGATAAAGGAVDEDGSADTSDNDAGAHHDHDHDHGHRRRHHDHHRRHRRGSSDGQRPDGSRRRHHSSGYPDQQRFNHHDHEHDHPNLHRARSMIEEQHRRQQHQPHPSE